MEADEAVLAVLSEEEGPVHWTVIQDLALRRGYLDPFTQRDVRGQVLAALAAMTKEGRVRRTGKGVYTLPSGAGA
jgi:hypothetical protein